MKRIIIFLYIHTLFYHFITVASHTQEIVSLGEQQTGTASTLKKLTDLPDDVLAYILEFLPGKDLALNYYIRKFPSSPLVMKHIAQSYIALKSPSFKSAAIFYRTFCKKSKHASVKAKELHKALIEEVPSNDYFVINSEACYLKEFLAKTKNPQQAACLIALARNKEDCEAIPDNVLSQLSCTLKCKLGMEKVSVLASDCHLRLSQCCDGLGVCCCCCFAGSVCVVAQILDFCTCGAISYALSD